MICVTIGSLTTEPKAIITISTDKIKSVTTADFILSVEILIIRLWINLF